MLEITQAEETFKVKVELRVWERPPLIAGAGENNSFSFHISVPSKGLVLNSVAKGAQALWELPAGGEFNGCICHMGRESARLIADEIWDELGEDYTIEQKQQMAVPYDGTEKYIIDLWPA